jgi:hypothetical protein
MVLGRGGESTHGNCMSLIVLYKRRSSCIAGSDLFIAPAATSMLRQIKRYYYIFSLHFSSKAHYSFITFSCSVDHSHSDPVGNLDETRGIELLSNIMACLFA